MSVNWRETARAAQALVQTGAQALIVALAVAPAAASLAAAFGLIPWPHLALFFGGQALPNAGMWLQIGLTLLLILMTFYLPANTRMARLERSHRSFAIGMDDVAKAYRQAHAADRAGVFALSGEFETMRARMEHLRQHPDFQHLEPELLQLAAQMSLETRDLAQVYSDMKVARAKDFLRQRQEEVQHLTDRLAIARRTCEELRRWMGDVQAEEMQVQIQLKRLEADLKEILPTLGYDFDLEDHRDANVVALPKPGK
ncbi:MAG: DNA repair protein [Cypionkella sp.]|uniref:DNA repair protein n=1 Tax=Cypionkella sp. TaxID=2811411 RepID=UPI002AB8E675|nr:DNA repair protein [Cypionkella sp.]MDZ4309159.1 DNA repair protein [Cypionkella sp.]